MPEKEDSPAGAGGASQPEPMNVDKGKGKAEEADKKPKEPKKDKDGKIIEEAKVDEELSEEDQKLKDELDMLVERLMEDDSKLYKPAIEQIKTFIKTSTSSMTAVPKPLKFLRPQYPELEKVYEKWPEGEDKLQLGDTLSVIGMTYSNEDRRDTLKYRLLSPSDDLGSWGHEYMRHLALEIGEEYQKRLDDEAQVEDLVDLALELVPFFLKHNAEADAVDILSELEMIEKIQDYLDENTYSRVCLYLVSMVPLLAYPFNDRFLRTAYKIYQQYNQYTQALGVAIRLNEKELIEEVFKSTQDRSIRRQMAFMLARQRIVLDLDEDEMEADPELYFCLGNQKIHECFMLLAKELNIEEPKTPEDIYKTHLESSRTAGLTNTDSARHNLASAFVNAFVNQGFSNDKLMLIPENSKSSWVWKTKDEGKMSTAASLGMLMQWDTDKGLDKIDNFTWVDDDFIRAGANLAIGMIHSGVRTEIDAAVTLLSDPDKFSSASRNVKLACVFGLGLAYAGSNKEELIEVLMPLILDTSHEMRLSAVAALSLGLVFVGSANSDVIEAIIQAFMDEDRAKQLTDKWTRFMALGLALLFFGCQEEVDVIIETLKAIDHPVSKASQVLADVCAFAGTGAVLKIQELLHTCNEHVSADKEEGEESAESDKDKDKDGKSKSEKAGDDMVQSYAVLGLALVAMGEDIGQEMILRQFGHLMHYGEPNIRKVVPLAMALVSPSNPQMKVYDTLSRYSHDNDIDVAINAIFAMGLLGAGTNNARLAQLLRQLASYYHRDGNALFMVRVAQGLLHMGKGTMSVNPFHSDRQILSKVSAAGLLTIMVGMIDAKELVLKDAHWLLYVLCLSSHPRFLVTLDEDLKPLKLNVRVGQAVDVVGQAGRPKTITGWQTQSTPVLLGYGERAELEDEQYVSLASNLEGVVILRKNPDWED